MGIRFSCPNGHKLNVKSFLAGKRAICPQCGTRVTVPDLPDTDAPETSSVVQPIGGPLVDELPLNAPSVGTSTPSVVIPLVESPPSVVAAGSAATIPSSVNVMPAVAAETAESAAMTASAIYQLRQARRRRNQLQIAIGLLIAVLLLAIALVWVLRRNATPSAPTGPNEKATSQFPRQDRASRHSLRNACHFTPQRLEGSC